MDESLAAVTAELEKFGNANDEATEERSRRMLNITRDTGEFLTAGRKLPAPPALLYRNGT